jgi:hypothetical protein
MLGGTITNEYEARLLCSAQLEIFAKEHLQAARRWEDIALIEECEERQAICFEFASQERREAQILRSIANLDREHYRHCQLVAELMHSTTD